MNCELCKCLCNTISYLTFIPEYEDHQIELKKEVDIFVSMLEWMGIK